MDIIIKHTPKNLAFGKLQFPCGLEILARGWHVLGLSIIAYNLPVLE